MPHFKTTEYANRIKSVQADLVQQDLDAIVLFAPESQYYLTGYDTFGFAMFQCLVLPANGKPRLLTRAPDRQQALHTSILTDEQIHIWVDREGNEPYRYLLDLLSQMALSGKKIGIESNTVGLTAHHWKRLENMLSNYVTLVEASELVAHRRRIKSPAEIACIRKAAELSDNALDAGLSITRADAFEGDILAEMQGEVFRGGGDYAGNEFIIGSAEGALLCRYYSGRRHLNASDQLTLEWSGAYRRYHAAMMRTIVVGTASDRQRHMHAAAVEALVACEERVRPGEPMGQVFDAHAKVLDKHGYAGARMNACGYGMGIAYNPIWVEHPMFYKDNPLLMLPGNVFFLHMILMDTNKGLAMCWGHSVLVTETGVERLSRHPLNLLER